jgi:NAD(P)-dependent dehydrogenase (short-subunit alcohol dehydrogenase family)
MSLESSRSVFITGASSGIGRAVAAGLARRGYTVMASVRKESDARALSALGIGKLKPICPLDLTDPAEVQTAAHRLAELFRTGQVPGLYAVINVAGGGSVSPIELMQISDFRDELEKRLVAPVMLIQTLLPFLRKTRGRILWISTPALFPVPYVAEIHAPDFAVNCLARTLNIELLPDGIRNILIRCGGIRAPSVRRSEEALARKLEGLTAEADVLYKERLVKLQDDLRKFDRKRIEPEVVADKIAAVLKARRPKVRYQVGYLSRLGAFFEKLPHSWADRIMERRER